MFGPPSILMERPCTSKTPVGLSWLPLVVPPLPVPHSLAGIPDGRFDGHTLTVWTQAKIERGGPCHSCSLAATVSKLETKWVKMEVRTGWTVEYVSHSNSFFFLC